MLTVKDRAKNPRYSPTSFVFTPNYPIPIPLPLQSLLVLNKQEADEDVVDKFNDVIQIRHVQMFYFLEDWRCGRGTAL